MTNAEVLRESVANQLRARQHLCWSQLVFSRFAAIGKELHRSSNESLWLYSLHASQVDAWILKTAVLQLTQMKIFARPVQTPTDSHWVRNFPPSSLLSPSIVPRTKSCSGHHYRMWLDKSIMRRHIHYNNVDFRHEMWNETRSCSLLSAWFLIRC